jgi:radical SAM superfamily enzyme YgiQ (UPF0313 family)
LASLYLKTAVDTSQELSFQTALFEFFLQDDPFEAAERCLQYDNPIIACSVYVWNRKWFTVFLRKIREVSPGTIIILGGPEVTADRDSFSAIGADAVISGEGELALIDFLKSLKSGSYRSTNVPSIFTDLAELPSPILSDPEHLKRYSGISWELTRGCPYACTFCYESKGNRTVRSFSIERLTKELEIILKSGVSNVFILDFRALTRKF